MHQNQLKNMLKRKNDEGDSRWGDNNTILCAIGVGEWGKIGLSNKKNSVIQKQSAGKIDTLP